MAHSVWALTHELTAALTQSPHCRLRTTNVSCASSYTVCEDSPSVLHSKQPTLGARMCRAEPGGFELLVSGAGVVLGRWCMHVGAYICGPLFVSARAWLVAAHACMFYFSICFTSSTRNCLHRASQVFTGLEGASTAVPSSVCRPVLLPYADVPPPGS